MVGERDSGNAEKDSVMDKPREQDVIRCILESLPKRWKKDRLYNLAKLRTSNVDKKAADGEQVVPLCNYIDVYNNDKITNGIEFMQATASDNEINRFSLQIDDVVITKDSESPDDIGIPALITEKIEDLVCGYHLTILRPIEDAIYGCYLFYAISSKLSAYQFYLVANGVTRFGLSYQGTKNLRIAFPEITEQKQIADFLDWKTGQIDALISKKKQLIEKLKEKRIAMITQAVTKGLNPDAPMRDSGIPWLGEVPEHWAVERLRFSITSNPVKSEVANLHNDLLVSFVPMEAVGEQGGIDLSKEKPIGDVYNGYTYFADGDIIIAKITPCFENGKGAIAEGLLNGMAFGTTEFHVMRPLESMCGRWLFYLSISYAFREIGTSEMLGAGGQKRVPEDYIKNFRIGIPLLSEQQTICDYLDLKNTQTDKLISKNEKLIEKLTEYRTALITAATTGKIDVRNFKIGGAA